MSLQLDSSTGRAAIDSKPFKDTTFSIPLIQSKTQRIFWEKSNFSSYARGLKKLGIFFTGWACSYSFYVLMMEKGRPEGLLAPVVGGTVSLVLACLKRDCYKQTSPSFSIPEGGVIQLKILREKPSVEVCVKQVIPSDVHTLSLVSESDLRIFQEKTLCSFFQEVIHCSAVLTFGGGFGVLLVSDKDKLIASEVLLISFVIIILTSLKNRDVHSENISESSLDNTGKSVDTVQIEEV